MTKRLITGIAGFIGSQLGRHLLTKYSNDKLIGFDKLTYAGNRENMKDYINHENFMFVHGDCCNLDDIAMLPTDIDEIFILHSETHVDRSINDPMIFAQSDFIGALNMLEYAKKIKAKVLYCSTDEVYGECTANDGSVESDGLFPKSPYAAAKAAADRMVYAYTMTFDVPTIITRGCNTYGHHQYPEKLIPFFIKCIENGKPCPIYGTGENIREWIHVDDHARAIDFAMNTSIPGEVYNIGTGTLKSVQNVYDTLKEYYPETSCIGVTDRPGHVVKHQVNHNKLEQLGWKPEINWNEGIKQTIEWYQTNKKWLNK